MPCAAAAARSGYDYTREIVLTAQHQLGDTLFFRKGNEVVSFAICHSVPLVEGRATEEMRVLKVVAKTEADFDHLVTQLCAYSRVRARAAWQSGSRASTPTYIEG